MNTEPKPKCPQCGEALPPDAPDGLCPKCVMVMNLKTETAFSGDSSAAQPPLPPEQIAPHFPQLEILECLGRGGMGVVYKARQKSLDRFVALKLLAPERVQDAKFAERFAREAQALAALNHPNIVTIYDFGQAGGFYFLLMEFVDGLNLRQLLRARKFTPEEALAIVPPLCDALQFAHDRSIVHRDIKPENLLLDKAGRVVVADFGIAKMLGKINGGGLPGESAATENATQAALGTPVYSAPEQKTDPQRVDSRADIYSLGVVFYELLTGELPGKRIEPPSRKVQIDVRLDEIVLRALEQKPELRYQQVSEVKTCLEAISFETKKTQVGNQRLKGLFRSFVPLATMLPTTRFSRSIRKKGLWLIVFEIWAAVIAFLVILGKIGSPAWNLCMSVLPVLPVLLLVEFLFRIRKERVGETEDSAGVPPAEPRFSKAKMAIAIGVAVVLAAAAAIVVVKATFFPAPPDSYFLPNYTHFQRLPSGLFILRPTHFSTPIDGLDYSCETDNPSGDHVTWNMGRNRSFLQLLCRMYNCDTNQIVLPPGAPTERFDYLYTLRDPNGLRHFEAAIKKLGYIAHWEDQPVRMLVVEKVAASTPSSHNPAAGGNVTFTIASSGNATNAAPNESRLPTSAFQIRLVAEDSDQSVPTDTATNFFEGTHFETLRLRREILMDGKAVESAGWNAADGRTNLILSLTEEGSRQFEALTGANLHRRLAMIFQGRVLFAPNIQAAIVSRTCEVPVNWDMKDLERTMNGLNQMNNPVANLRFGPEQESILPRLNGNSTFLNLRANRLLSATISDFESRAFYDWQRENGADLGAAVEEKFPLLVAYGMATVPAFANGLDNASPTDIWYNWNLMVNEPKAQSYLVKSSVSGKDTYYFRTRDDTWGVLQITGFTENPRGMKVRYKLVLNGQPPEASPDAVSGSQNDSRLVIDTEHFDIYHPEPGELDWGFKCFIPPDHLASFLFVRWTNGVPIVDTGYSTYFKVGKAGGIDLFCSLSCYRIASESDFSKLSDAERRKRLAAWNYPESAGITNAVRWNVNLGAGFTASSWIAMPPFNRDEIKLPQTVQSGHQRVIRLGEFAGTDSGGNHGQSGVELRIFLEPLRSPPIRMVPNEVDRTNYVSGSGLAGTMEDALNQMKSFPVDP